MGKKIISIDEIKREKIESELLETFHLDDALKNQT